jgi:hypothetical protein
MFKPNAKSNKKGRKYESRKSEKYQAQRRHWKDCDAVAARKEKYREKYNPNK